ncbi:MAG TPA: 50S ribosomal protein L4 [Thermomicrobiales bacterium]|nr:50S ribosomal protein L4 [Thermomicrobiales bacterium]
MQVEVRNLAGEVVDQLELSDFVFGIEPNVAVMHQALVRQHANQRQGTHSTKTRGEVRGGGRKPWRQKGTGRARQGSIRAPHWKGGGVVFGPKPRDYTQDMPKRMRRLALRSALSAKARDGQLVVIDSLADLEGRTKAMVGFLDGLGSARGTVIATAAKQENVARAGANLSEVRVLQAANLNLHDLLKHHRLILDRDAIGFIEETWGEASEERLRAVRRAA